MLRNHKCGHADVRLHMLEQYCMHVGGVSLFFDMAVSAILHARIVVCLFERVCMHMLCVSFVGCTLVVHSIKKYVEVTYAHATCVHTQVYYWHIHKHLLSHLRSTFFSATHSSIGHSDSAWKLLHWTNKGFKALQCLIPMAWLNSLIHCCQITLQQKRCWELCTCGRCLRRPTHHASMVCWQPTTNWAKTCLG